MKDWSCWGSLLTLVSASSLSLKGLTLHSSFPVWRQKLSLVHLLLQSLLAERCAWMDL